MNGQTWSSMLHRAGQIDAHSTAIVGRETITLHCDGRQWLATFSDPKVLEFMGSATIPTAWLARAPAARVLADIQERNPGCDVRLDAAYAAERR